MTPRTEEDRRHAEDWRYAGRPAPRPMHPDTHEPTANLIVMVVAVVLLALALAIVSHVWPVNGIEERRAQQSVRGTNANAGGSR